MTLLERLARLGEDGGRAVLFTVVEGEFVRISDEEMKAYARKVTAFGEWCADKGMPLAYHHHMAAVVETEPELDAFMAVALTQHPIGHPGVDEQVDAVLLEDARPHGPLDLEPRSDVDDDGADAGPREQVGEHQSGRAAAHDPDGGARDGAWGHGTSVGTDHGTWPPAAPCPPRRPSLA